MAVHEFRREQFISSDLSTVWKFFSCASNLQKITPASMKFTVTSRNLPEDIYPGMVITYKVSPVLHIPLFWMTEIMHVIPQKMFVDEQRRGPYSLWHHQHHFEEKDGGVLMTDIVHYELPLGILGELAHVLFVKRQLNDIFNFRTEKVDELFVRAKRL